VRILKYYGTALSNLDWMLKKLRENEFGELGTAALQYFAVLPPLRKLDIEA
jgi:hypothetical protein